MKQCKKCGKEFKRQTQLEEHKIEHQSPKFNNDGTVLLSGGHQIVLIVKDSFNDWKDYFKTNRKKGIDKSWVVDGKKLQRFEKRHNIQFFVKGDGKTIQFKENVS